MRTYFSRVTRSARGELFNPLLWPFLMVTFAHGLAFALILPFTALGGSSGLYSAMQFVSATFPIIWGWLAILVIVGGLTFLMFNVPPFGKASGLAGFALWAFAGICYGIVGDWILLVAIAIPQMWFWFWQYLSLAHFRHEEARDKETLSDFDEKSGHSPS